MPDNKSKPVKYASKDFAEIKNDLVDYAKIYYPETFKDFNAASFGSLMLDTVAYIGDMLSFYIDYQSNESFIDSAIETKNLLKLAKQFGYKNTPSFSATGKCAFYVQVPANSDGTENRTLIPILKQGTTLGSNAGVSLTLTSDVDFSRADTEIVVAETTAAGLQQTYAYKAYGDVVAGIEETEILTVGTYQKFLKLQLDGDNITEIISVIDSEGNEYFEVPYLSQNVVLQPVRNPSPDGDDDAPYILREKLAARRFITEVGEDGRTSIQFGFGSEQSLKNDDYPDPANVALDRYGRDYYSDDSFDPLVLLKNDKFGVVPPEGDLIVTYRRNDAESVNLPVNSINTVTDPLLSYSTDAPPSSATTQFIERSLDVDNEEPLLGQISANTQEEIRIRATNAYASQNRAVTKQDYLSSIYRMPAKFGAVKRANIVQDKDSFKRNLIYTLFLKIWMAI